MTNGSTSHGSKLIKRYANRKLYDTARSCYVTLEEIADMVKAGEDLRIIDNRTGEDLTGVTLTQIIYEDQKKTDQKSVLPLGALRSIIQSGGEIFSRLTPAKKTEEPSAARRGSRYDGPYGRDELGVEAYGEPHLPRYTSRDPREALRLDDIYELMVRLDQRMERMERQVQSLTQQVARLGDETRRQGERQRQGLSRQKSKPMRPL